MAEAKKVAHVDGQVVAIALGFDGHKLRDVGEVFSFKGPQGSWFELYKAPPKPKAPKADD